MRWHAVPASPVSERPRKRPCRQGFAKPEPALCYNGNSGNGQIGHIGRWSVCSIEGERMFDGGSDGTASPVTDGLTEKESELDGGLGAERFERGVLHRRQVVGAYAVACLRERHDAVGAV